MSLRANVNKPKCNVILSKTRRTIFVTVADPNLVGTESWWPNFEQHLQCHKTHPKYL